MIHTFTVRLTAADLLSDIGARCWAIPVAATDLPAAWRKFVKHHRAPVYRSADLISIADDYDISLDRQTLPNIIGTT